VFILRAGICLGGFYESHFRIHNGKKALLVKVIKAKQYTCKMQAYM
jgi:hypothetical protein